MIEELQKQIAELQEDNACWRNMYVDLGYELGKVINKQQDKIISITNENRRLKCKNRNLEQTKGRY